MRAVILAGGLGTRLRPYTTVIPKPLVPIGDRPVLEHIIRSLVQSGVDRIDLCVNHLGELILIYLANADIPPEVRLAFHWETRAARHGGRARHGARSRGDVHRRQRRRADHARLPRARRVPRAAGRGAHRRDARASACNIDLGVIESDDGLVNNYIEKPSLHYEVSMGVYVYDERALAYLPRRRLPVPRPRAAAAGGRRARRRLPERRRLVRHRDGRASTSGPPPTSSATPRSTASTRCRPTEHELRPGDGGAGDLDEVARRRAAAAEPGTLSRRLLAPPPPSALAWA